MEYILVELVLAGQNKLECGVQELVDQDIGISCQRIFASQRSHPDLSTRR